MLQYSVMGTQRAQRDQTTHPVVDTCSATWAKANYDLSDIHVFNNNTKCNTYILITVESLKLPNRLCICISTHYI